MDLRTAVGALGLALALGLTAPVAATAAHPDGTKGATTRDPSARCVNASGDPCKTAKQYRRAFKRGDLGKTPYSKSKFSKAFKTKLRKAAVKKGLIPPAGRSAARGSFKYDGWRDYWDAFNNALDCVAPGAESSCAKDFDEIKPLEKPAKVVIGCGGLAVMAFYTGGASVPATAAISGALTCSWGIAIDAW